MSEQCNHDIVTRSPEEERKYMSRRAEHHRHAADNAADTSSRNIHLRLSELYHNQAALIDVVYSDHIG
jgi:hypothetical protein